MGAAVMAKMEVHAKILIIIACLAAALRGLASQIRTDFALTFLNVHLAPNAYLIVAIPLRVCALKILTGSALMALTAIHVKPTISAPAIIAKTVFALSNSCML